MSERPTFDIATTAVIKFIVVIIVFVFLYLLRDVIMILFFAIMITSAVTPLVNRLEGLRVPRLASVLVLYFLVASLGGFLLAVIVPVAGYELRQLTIVLPKFFSDVSSVLESIPSLQSLVDNLGKYLQLSSASGLSFIVSIFGGTISFLSIIVISFYLSLMRQGIPTFLQSVLPDRYEEYAIGLWHRSEIKVGRWFQGQLLLALAMGLIVFLGLTLMKVKYALVLGIIAMLLEIVPIAGPVLAAIPAIILASLQSPGLGVGTFIFYAVVQQLENHLLMPLILGKSTGLHPVTVIIALLIGAKLAGILGILLAVPVAVIIVEVLDDLAESRKAVRTE